MGIRKFYAFIEPYRSYSFLAMFLLISTIFFDLTIPRIIQEIIDQGVIPRNSSVVLRYTLLMLGFTVISALLTIGNTFLSVRVAQGFGADIRSSIYKKIGCVC